MTEGETKSRSAIVWSLIIHCILLVIIIIQVDLGAKRKKEFFETDLINKQIVKTSIVVLTHPVIVEEKKTVEVDVIKEQIFNETKVVKKSIIEAEIKKQPQEKIKESIDEIAVTENKDITEDKSPVSQDTQPVTISKDTLSKSRKFIQQQISAAPVYQAENEGAGMSVMNNNLSQHRYTVIEEKTLKEKLAIKITCDSIASKTTAAISTLTGGRLTCEKGPDLSSFIKKKEKPRFKYKLD